MKNFERVDKDYTLIEVVKVKEITLENGTKFNAFKTTTATGKLMDLRFTQAVDKKSMPTKPCFIKVENDDWNVDDNRKYPILWVQSVAEVIPYPTTKKQII